MQSWNPPEPGYAQADVDSVETVRRQLTPPTAQPAAQGSSPVSTDKKESKAEPEKKSRWSSGSSDAEPLRRKDVLIAALIYVVDIGVVAFWAYDLFGKMFDLVHNKCTVKSLTNPSVQCDLIRPPSSALFGLLIAGGGMTLALLIALVIASAAAVTRRSAWIWTAAALPVILIAGAAGHVLVTSAIG
ncbi:hypothetical protein AB0N05_19005 [Nocardia sp. NPDC051030]|uniref:hypothetical protein n=1 Tax=Nocardia sp. NPDC051030 TaxID=3155162 RepID=UPI0034158F29